jgi:lipid-A-disaccharide synthase
LIVGREIVPELLQDLCRPEELAKELKTILTDSPRRRIMENDLRTAATLLGTPGASAKVLAIIMEEIGAVNG